MIEREEPPSLPATERVYREVADDAIEPWPQFFPAWGLPLSRHGADEAFLEQIPSLGWTDEPSHVTL
jgi:hypothetical protein